MGVNFIYGANPADYPGADAANAANESRYQQILAGYNNTANTYNSRMASVNQGYSDLLAGQQGYGKSQRQDLADSFARQQAQSQQSMISRGMGNTTVLDAAQRGIGYDQAKAGLTLEDQLQQRLLNISQNQLDTQKQAAQGYAGIQGNQLDFMGTRTDQAVQRDRSAEMAAQQNYANLTAQTFPRQQQQGGGYTGAGSIDRSGIAGGYQISPMPFGGQTGGYYVGGGGYGAQQDYGYDMNTGGRVPGKGNTDSVRTNLTPGEFVLSHKHIADLKSGKLTSAGLLKLVSKGPGKPKSGYADGGLVPREGAGALEMSAGSRSGAAAALPMYGSAPQSAYASSPAQQSDVPPSQPIQPVQLGMPQGSYYGLTQLPAGAMGSQQPYANSYRDDEAASAYGYGS